MRVTIVSSLVKFLSVTVVSLLVGLTSFAAGSAKVVSKKVEAGKAAPSQISVNVDGYVYNCVGDGNGGVCSTKAEAYRRRLSQCLQANGNGNFSYCNNSIWPDYKTKNAACIDEASAHCMDLCLEALGNGNYAYCNNSCK